MNIHRLEFYPARTPCIYWFPEYSHAFKYISRAQRTYSDCWTVLIPSTRQVDTSRLEVEMNGLMGRGRGRGRGRTKGQDGWIVLLYGVNRISTE
ncbi:hypothetical protein EYC84_002392 [Monilinia fructicola]|uniref:Uncharacterized protein n=1 Tax=Monilinia fructicola TaxID=38448 RepID=A0A5M9JMV8_MONFR|nr:hypothetical protein EYC84_002392 [Monilinia fructicola]